MTNDERYLAALHKVQSAIAVCLAAGGELASFCTVKHMRVGVDSAHISDRGLVELLISKGIITEEEHMHAIAIAAEKEALEWEAKLSQYFGKEIKLG